MARRAGVKIAYLERTTSSSDAARSEQFGHGDVVVAGEQTSGRGQRGNGWESGKGLNLTVSIIMKPVFLPASDQFLLSKAVSLAVADTLEDYGIAARVKWPNDIYVGAGKIAGILIENDICGSTLARSIIGVGLNVNQEKFSEGLPNPVSMLGVAGRVFDRVEVLGRLYDKLSARYAQLEAGRVDEQERDYHARLYRQGERHNYRRAGGGIFAGTIECVRHDGELMVRHADGTLKGYLFKEIEYVL